MPYKYKRDCPICHKPDLQFISDHFRIVHHLFGYERKKWLSLAPFSQSKVNSVAARESSVLSPCREKKCEGVKSRTFVKYKEKKTSIKRAKGDLTLSTEPYNDFKFRHKFSLLVVGPTQSGKTYFVQQILENNSIKYEDNKPIRIFWYYNQWQQRYDVLRESLGRIIEFEHGLPELSDDLHEINPKYNNIIILDDLMAEATGSPLVARLFTQGRHRNASVILLLQNMFPKGKYNTDISRNGQYLALFRSPSDRKQIGIIAERMFDKNRNQFMIAYHRETEKPFGYLLVDNKPDTPSNRQVIGDIFGRCHVYTTINNSKEQTAVTVSHQPQYLSKPPSINWSDAVIPVWQNYTNNSEYLKTIPEGFDIVEMYKTSRNPNYPNQPGVNNGGELYWPVKIRNQTNGRFKWINLHENNPTIKSIVEDVSHN